MNVIDTIKETTADGYGLRYSIYVAGCKHHCLNCHNKSSWDFNQGTSIFKVQDIIFGEIEDNPLLDGITVSGGDPFYHSQDLSKFLWNFKQRFPLLTVWVYTGYTIEELVTLYREGNYDISLAMNLIDYLVDGPYEESLKEYNTYKGSSNQRIIENPINIFEDIKKIQEYE